MKPHPVGVHGRRRAWRRRLEVREGRLQERDEGDHRQRLDLRSVQLPRLVVQDEIKFGNIDMGRLKAMSTVENEKSRCPEASRECSGLASA